MGIPRLRKLTLKAFRTFAEETVIEFPDSGAVLLSGASGVGKSNLTLAIAYLFGYCPLPSTALQSWLTDEPMQVRGELSTDAGPVVVTRGSKLSISVGEEVFKGSSAVVEAKLDEILGLSPDLRLALTYREQRGKGLFLSKTDSEKKEFLTEVLGLHKFEIAVETAQANLKKLATDKIQHETRLGEATSNLKVLQIDLNMHVLKDTSQLEQVCSIVQQQVGVSKGQVEQAETLLKNVQLARQAELSLVPTEIGYSWDDSELQKQRSMLASAQERLKKVQEQDQAEQRRVSYERSSLEHVIQALYVNEHKIKSLNSSLGKRFKEIQKLLDSKCDRCDRAWDKALEEARKLERVQQEETNEISRLQQSVDTIPQRNKEIEALVFVPNDMGPALQQCINTANTAIVQEETQKQNTINNAAIAKKQQIHEIQQKYTQEESSLYSALSTAKETYHRAQLDLKSKENDLNQIVTSNDIMVKSRQTTERRLAEATKAQEEHQANLDGVTKNLNAEEDFIALVGREGFLGSIFDEVLAEISNETNEILGSITNTQNITIQFKSESQTKSGTIKRSIVPVMSIGGYETPIKAGCSGGQSSSVELAVDLAMAKVIARRTGSLPGWLILDESFDGMDVPTRENCIEFLSKYAQDRLVLVIDHGSETKEMFTKVINVQNDNGRSRLAS